MKQSDCLAFVIMAVVCGIVRFALGAASHESAAYAFRFIGLCTILRAGCDLIERLRR